MMKTLSNRKKRLSFGLDWGDRSAKLVGLRMVGDEFELTHCILFDLPEKANPQFIVKNIQKRLFSIDLYGGVLTIGVPIDDLQFEQVKNNSQLKNRFVHLAERLFERGSWANRTIVQVNVTENYINRVWYTRMPLVNRHTRVEMEDLSLPLVENAHPGNSVHVYLQIGFHKSRITLSKGTSIVDHCTFEFSLQDFIPDDFNLDPKRREIVLNVLRKTQLQYKNSRWNWKSTVALEKTDDLFSHVLDKLSQLASTIRSILQEYREKHALSITEIRTVGDAGLYPCINTYLSKKLQLQVKNIETFARMNKGNELQSSKLQEMEPLFAQSVALALSGVNPKNDPNKDIKKTLSWYYSDGAVAGKKLRAVALMCAFLSVLIFTIFSFRFTAKYQESLVLGLENKDLTQQIHAVKNHIFFENMWQKNQGKKLYNQQSPRVSQLMKIIGEEIPNGTWITTIHLLPAASIKEFRKEKKGMAVQIDGKAISENYISDFYNKLNQSGFFTQLIIKRQDDQNEYSGTINYRIIAKIVGHDAEI